MHGEDKDWGYDKDGNSLNPVDIEKKKRKDDDLFGAPNSKKKKVKEDRDEPLRDQDDQQIANVTFDGGGPDGGATIKGSGDPREIPTFVALIKNKMRARGILVNHNELEGDMVEGYQRNPEKGEEEARKADTRTAKQKRMDDPKKGINSPAFKKFMASRGM